MPATAAKKVAKVQKKAIKAGSKSVKECTKGFKYDHKKRACVRSSKPSTKQKKSNHVTSTEKSPPAAKTSGGSSPRSMSHPGYGSKPGSMMGR